jgi:hypothetical protein
MMNVEGRLPRVHPGKQAGTARLLLSKASRLTACDMIAKQHCPTSNVLSKPIPSISGR